MYIILKSELKFITKEVAKVLEIMIIGFILIIAMILTKYKPLYEITIAGENIGYLKDKIDIENVVKEQIKSEETNNIDSIVLKNEIAYKMKLVSRSYNENRDNIIKNVKENNTIVTYKYYNVALNDENQAKVNTFEEAEEIVNKIKSEYDGDGLELNLQILEEYVDNAQKIEADTIEVATNNVESKVEELIEEENTIAKVNGIKLYVLPVNGMITSRYGESSSRRSSRHTGLDIACSTGTKIKAVAPGKVTFAASSGSYGNLVKIDHGNGVETWYGHCNTISTKVGANVNAGDIIATVGSTGNSTGPHLHFEIRINNATVNPQQYIY